MDCCTSDKRKNKLYFIKTSALQTKPSEKWRDDPHKKEKIFANPKSEKGSCIWTTYKPIIKRQITLVKNGQCTE